MTQGTPASTRSTAPGPSGLTNLSHRHDLPRRVRSLLDGVLGLSSITFSRLVAATLDEFEATLFKQAEQARSNETMQRCFDALREVKRARADVAPRFMMALEDLLARFDRHMPSAEPAAPRAPRVAPVRESLSLIASDALEESLAVQELASKVEIRQALPLHSLGHRFGVLAALPALDAETVPLGPAKLGLALRHAAACLDIAVEQRVLLYHLFDRIAMNHIGAFYDAANKYFVDQGILRHLHLYLHLRLQTTPEKNSLSLAPTDEPDAQHPPLPTTGIDLRAAQAAPAHEVPAGVGTLPAWTPPLPQSGAPVDARDSELFSTLRELLAGRQHAMSPLQREQNAHGYIPSADDVQSVLGALQIKPVVLTTMDGRPVQRSIGQLRQDLLNQLRPLAPPGQTPQLTSEDADTIDLVGMLFDYLGRNAPANGNTQALLTKLQVPLLRVALRDKSFFTRRTHPARQLLNTIAETGVHWIDGGDDDDPALVKKMQMVIDRLSGEFDGNLGLIEESLADVSQHMHTLARKAEMAERRLVEATKGRERLVLARDTANDAIAQRIGNAKPGRLLRTMLEQAWTDVLTLTLLRQGEKSETYKKQLSIADQLLSADAGSRGGKTTPPAVELRQEVEAGLGQVGYHQDEIQAVVRRLFAPEEVANEENPPSQTDLALRLKSKARLGATGDEQKSATPPEPRKMVLNLNADEKQMLERLKTVPFGTWFEFAVNQQGERVRRKLSWFSPLTGRCLFVNQRGARVDERSLDQLARDMLRGQASIAKAEHESLVDRTWKTIVTSLRQMAGHGPEPLSA